MRDALDSIDTGVMQAGFDAFLQKISDAYDALEKEKLPALTEEEVAEVLGEV